MARRSGDKAAAGWNSRTAGLVICAFFVMGVMTGFSETGRAVTLRTGNALGEYRDRLIEAFAPTRDKVARHSAVVLEWIDRAGIYPRGVHRAAAVQFPQRDAIGAGAIAIVERRDGFYTLLDGGELRGPVSPGKESDLPILSGPALEDARGEQMVEYATVLVRAEAQLSEIISEMQVEDDGTASLFLERERTEVVVDLSRVRIELQRALEVRRQWNGRENLIAALDMTTPGQAVVRLHGAEGAPIKHKNGIQIVSNKFLEPGAGQLRKGPVTR